MKIVISENGRSDGERLAEFLSQLDQATALRAVASIEAAASSLADLPERGSVVSRTGIRRLVVSFGRAAYLIDYRVDHAAETVTILRVRHSREAR